MNIDSLFLTKIIILHRKSPKPTSEKAGKKPRVWDLGGTTKDLQNLERTTDKPADEENNFSLDTEV